VRRSLGFYSDVADSADEVIAWPLAFIHGQDFNGISLVVRSEDELTAGGFDVFDGAGSVLEDGIHVVLTLAIRLERVVMAVDEQCGAGQEAGVHAHAFAGVGFDGHESLPTGAVAFDFRLELPQKALFEFQDLLHMHADQEGMGGGDATIGDEDVLKLIIAGRQDGSALVDLGGVEEIEDGKMLDGQDTIHAFEAEAALAVEEVGDVSLLEAGLLRQAEPGEIAFFNPFPKSIAKIFLQNTEFHGREYSTRYSRALIGASFPQLEW
jgi:hypothetical protein